MKNLIISQNPPFLKWKEKRSILMVTFIMVGTGLIFIPLIGFFNQTIHFNNPIEAIASLLLLSLGAFLIYLGLSTSFKTIYFLNNAILIEHQIGFLKLRKQYDLPENTALLFETYEDEDGICWYHLIQQKNEQKVYILKFLEEDTYQALQIFITA